VRKIYFTILKGIMKKKFLSGMILCIMIIFVKPVAAQDHGFGVGVILGEPTGISAKLWTSSDNAIDFGLGFSDGGDRIAYNGDYDGDTRYHFHMDYLWHSFNAINSVERFPIYYGIGFMFNNGAGYDAAFGVRGVIGIAWLSRSIPIDIFAELAPVLQLTSVVGLGVEGGVGIRYFFE
jgi:hypothetical protein